MIRMEEALAAKKLGAQMLLQVHDELVFEVPEARSREDLAGGQAGDGGRAPPRGSLSVPLAVDAHAADNWDEAH